MKKMMKNKAKVMGSKHYAEGYCPFYYKVYGEFLADVLFDCSDCFRFYLADDALLFAIDQISLLAETFRYVHAPYRIVVYKDGFKRPVLTRLYD